MVQYRIVVIACLLVVAGGVLAAQVPPPAAQSAQGQVPTVNLLRPDYTLGPNDQILVRVPNAEELNERPFRVDSEGSIVFPIVGRLPVNGLTVRSLEAELATRLREFIRDPQVNITVVQFRSEPVTLLGAFMAPGVYPLSRGRTLVEMLAAAGGLQANASRRIRVTRRAEYGPIPLPTAVEDPEKMGTSAEISLETLMQSPNPAEDIVLQAYDVITAEQAAPVYVFGEVARPGPIPLAGQDTISVTQALSTVGGFTPSAKRDRVTVLRPIIGTSRKAEIEIDLKELLAGRINDFPLLPNDVLVVGRTNGFRGALGPVSTAVAASLPATLVWAILVNR
jgi:polysaccharide export outer membrane protein